ncbi:MAG TPA: hypothetical protein VH120_01850 [Gemmataceae bacterium]|jgi:hypothetical protein|nr:hypothetical protein [Gemmataceae bacterium]
MTGSFRRFALVTVLLAAPVFAQPPADSPARSVEADVKLALRDAQRLADTDAAAAIDRLDKLLTALQADRVLSANRRAQLIRIVDDRIRVVKAAPAPTPELGPPPLPAEAKQRAEELAGLRAGLKEAVALRRQGKVAEANAKAAELSKQFPESVAVQVLNDFGRTAGQRQETHVVRKEKEESTLAGLSAVDRAAVMPRNDMEFAKDHKERMTKRRAATAPTAAELKILQSLETSVTPKFKDTRLEDAADYLSTLIGLPIVLDKSALDELNLNYNSPVTFVMNKPIGARTALRGMLRTLGLTYVVREGTVFVTSPSRAREYLTLKAYSLGDLVVPVGNPFFPAGDPLQEAFNVQSLIDLIVSTIDPESWDVRGGPGTIRYYAPTRSIVVRQSQEVHVSLKASIK